MLRRYRRQIWWTRERVLAGLRRFYRERGEAITDCKVYHRATTCGLQMSRRRYPSFAAVLRHFPTFRAAWEAAGITCDRTHEDWTAEEDWYLREAAGIISRLEIARDLRRTPDAVHRRLYDLGLHSYRVHGWALKAAAAAGGTTAHWLLKAIKAGSLPARMGSKCWQIQPADLVYVPQVRWEVATPDLLAAARHGWLCRLATALRRRA